MHVSLVKLKVGWGNVLLVRMDCSGLVRPSESETIIPGFAPEIDH